LRFRAKSAMAEILVCLSRARSFMRPGALRFGGPCLAHPCAAHEPVTLQPDVEMRPNFRLFPLFFVLFFPLLSIVFAIVIHCFCADGFSLARAMPCIVIGGNSPL